MSLQIVYRDGSCDHAATGIGVEEGSMGAIRVSAAIGLLLMTGCAVPASPGVIPPVPVAGARSAPGPLPGHLVLPAGPGPHAVVILLHGCGGVSAGIRLWADRLLEWGYGSLILDSLTPRSLASVCPPSRQKLLTPFDRAGDVVSAARWLQTQPGVDGHRLAVLGDSHGGGTATATTLHPYADALKGMVRGAVNYYGPCRNQDRYAGMPLLALAGDADTWSDPAITCKGFGSTLPPGNHFAQAIYPGVVHGFDNPQLLTRRFNEGHPMQYDRAAAEDSFTRVRSFFGETIGPPG